MGDPSVLEKNREPQPAAPAGTAALSVNGLAYAYPAPSGARRALDGLCLEVSAGEVFGLLGPNGGGKTTLFRILSTMLLPDSGEALIFGRDVAREPQAARARIGVVFQRPSLDKKLSVRENLDCQGRLYGLSGAALAELIRVQLERAKLLDRAGDLAETLSGGMQRRLEIAKSLLHSPRLVLMDEPSSGLDPGARRDLWDQIADLKAQGVTVLLTTHLTEEAERCDRIAILNRGKIVALGRPSSLKQEIGGDVIVVECADAQALAKEVRARFGLDPIVTEGRVHVERERGHEFVPDLVRALGAEITSVTVSKPSLEDVFLHRTGHQFWREEPGE